MEAAFTLRLRPGNINRRLKDQEISVRIARIAQVLPELRRRLDPCALCPRLCAAHRLAGEVGSCGLGSNLRVASVARHTGEEPPISGRRGAINVFFSGCSLHCLHCQNWPISQQRVGRDITPAELAYRILQKWRRGAHSLGWVTPTPQIIGALEAYELCLQAGCDLPLVHNGGGYEDVRIVRLLSGIVDVWLPDAKTCDPDRASAIQNARNYATRNLPAIAAMVEQVGGAQARAVIVRHLILPGGLDDSRQVLTQLWESFGRRIHLSLMAQYFPAYHAAAYPALGRKISSAEYHEIVAFARKLGFRKGWIQQPEVEDGIPLHCLP